MIRNYQFSNFTSFAHSMMGCKLLTVWQTLSPANNYLDGADKGIIPLTCSELFVRVDQKKATDPHVNFTVEVSYIEVRSFAFRLSVSANMFKTDL